MTIRLRVYPEIRGGICRVGGAEADLSLNLGRGRRVCPGGSGRPAASIFSTPATETLANAWQDCELLLLAAGSRAELQERGRKLGSIAGQLSRAELTDLAAELARTLPEERQVRAAVVAGNPSQLVARLGRLRQRLAATTADEGAFARGDGYVMAGGSGNPRIGLLFSGQGSASSQAQRLCHAAQEYRYYRLRCLLVVGISLGGNR